MMSNRLQELWERQTSYNILIRGREFPNDRVYWTKQYLLGLVAEIDEVLSEINWKIHRRGHAFNQHNLARELADIVKFSWCLWELYGYTSNDMLDFVEQKTEELEQQYQQDFITTELHSNLIIITDIDGTLADWRKALRKWFVNNNNEDVLTDVAKNMAIEIDLQIPYARYIWLKEEFDANGGYLQIEPYSEIQSCLKTLVDRNVENIV